MNSTDDDQKMEIHIEVLYEVNELIRIPQSKMKMPYQWMSSCEDKQTLLGQG